MKSINFLQQQQKNIFTDLKRLSVPHNLDEKIIIFIFIQANVLSVKATVFL